MPSLTEKDRADLAVALVAGVDYVGLSFVRTAADVTALREAIEAAGSPARIVAKIETAEAVENRTAILEAADAVMVARGDLGVEIGSERVPVVQKETILAGVAANRPVITATEMLESMIRNPRPTRAETSDVANAVFDGSDAVMLSGETSIGEHPAAAVGMMRRIAVRAERHLARYGAAALLHREPERTFGDAIGCAARDLAGTLGARAIVAFTRSGATALRISRWRPVVPVVAFTPDEGVARRLAPVWGVLPRLFPAVRSVDDMLGRLDPRLCEAGLARPGDVVVVVAGAPVGEAGRTNFLTLHRLAGPEAKE
jgi:pyruvate kinase